MKRYFFPLVILLLMAAVIAIENYTNLDIIIQNHIFNFETKAWPIPHELHKKLSPIFYNGMKALVTAIGTICAIYLLSCWKIEKNRKKFLPVLVVLLSTMLVPATVGKLKRVTNTYCPAQLQEYNGPIPYVKLLQHYPADFHPPHPGRCFPAGHVTGTFSLMALYLIFEDRRRKYAALAFAITLGCIAGTYQMLRGEHFLSHNLTSALLAALIIYFLNLLLKQIQQIIEHHRNARRELS